MGKLFNIFKETVQHMTLDEIAVQLYLININRRYPVPGDIVDAINEFQFPFLKRIHYTALSDFVLALMAS